MSCHPTPPIPGGSASRVTKTPPRARASVVGQDHQAPAAAKLPKRRKQEKTPGSGRDFAKGQNSHTGEVFQRGPTTSRAATAA